jgi:hypothetical protein
MRLTPTQRAYLRSIKSGVGNSFVYCDHQTRSALLRKGLIYFSENVPYVTKLGSEVADREVGRPRVHRDNAEKQKVYRQRKLGSVAK